MSDSPPGVGHIDSMDSNDPAPKQQEKKSRRPANTAFRQQRLKAWQPILTPKSVLPLFFTIGIIFAPIGGLLLYASAQVQELSIDYTTCSADAPDYPAFSSVAADRIGASFKNSSQNIDVQWSADRNTTVTMQNGVNITTNRCYLQFSNPDTMNPPVFLYYHLTNFYQNHRRYVDSFDQQQLKGEARSYDDIRNSKCTPLYGALDDGIMKPYYPCGLIANSMFNDTFNSSLEWLNPSGAKGTETRFYDMTTDDISWSSDSALYNPTKYNVSQILPPPNWAKRYPDNYTTSNPPPNLVEWDAFQVWMRTAGLPSFSKLYQRNDIHSLLPGRYQITIADNFPTTEYRGHKSVLITTGTVMGGHNPFLGIAYIAVGGVCIGLGALFTITHLFKPRKLGDHTYLSWNNAPASKTSRPATAMASGREIRPGEA